jgi:hypothetical protein
MKALGRFVVIAGFGSLVWAACGGDDDDGGGGGGEDRVALCKQACEKLLSVCFGDGGGGTSCANSCTTSDAGTSGATCSNESEMLAAYKACLEKATCTELIGCMSAAPRCQTGSGAG